MLCQYYYIRMWQSWEYAMLTFCFRDYKWPRAILVLKSITHLQRLHHNGVYQRYQGRPFLGRDRTPLSAAFCSRTRMALQNFPYTDWQFRIFSTTILPISFIQNYNLNHWQLTHPFPVPSLFPITKAFSLI